MTSLFLFISILPILYSKLICPDSDSLYSRQDYSFIGITQNECISKSCCWQPSNVHSPYCTYPLTHNKPNYYSPYLKSSSQPFQQNEIDTFFQYFLNNIDINLTGAVVATPDLNRAGGSYFYHWSRDGALTINTLFTYDNSTFSKKYADDYLKWIQLIKSKKDPINIDIKTEPKYGNAYTGGWCRPQNDGLLFRIKKYIQNYSFHMYEQIDKNTGKQISAYDLTWSYAELLNALKYRGN